MRLRVNPILEIVTGGIPSFRTFRIRKESEAGYSHYNLQGSICTH